MGENARKTRKKEFSSDDEMDSKMAKKRLFVQKFLRISTMRESKNRKKNMNGLLVKLVLTWKGINNSLVV